MHELIILFLYHRNNQITLNNLRKLQASNPDCQIITVCCGLEKISNDCFILREAKKDLFDAAKFNQKHLSLFDILAGNSMPQDGVWYGMDAVIYTWFLNRTISAKRYIILEWDCHCTINLKDLYAPNWNSNLAVAEHSTKTSNPDWFWFHNDLEKTRHLDKIEGVAPIAGMLISHQTLSKLTEFLDINSRRYSGVFSEIRLGSALKELEIEVEKIVQGQNHQLSPFLTIDTFPDNPGLYHPIKFNRSFYRVRTILANLLEKWRRIIWRIRKLTNSK